MKIGAFAKACRVPADTVRYYEKIGLLSSGTRNAAGYRLFDSNHVVTMRFIRNAQSLGMSLETIRQLLEIQLNKEEAHCEDVKLFVGGQLEELDKQIDELVAMRSAMAKLHDACCGGLDDARCCSILQALEVGNV